MAESDTSASSIVRQTRLEYEEMRQKLAETEKKLNRLAKLEAQDQTNTAQSTRRSHQITQRGTDPLRVNKYSHDSTAQQPIPQASVEDQSSVKSELSTIPGSYTGFANRAFPASTPCKQTLPYGDGQPETGDVYDSDSSGSMTHAIDSTNNNGVKLLRQNQRLLSEVERLVCELQAAKHREGELQVELDSNQGQVTELREQVEEMQAEIEAQDKALRSAEQHLSESQRQMSSIQQEQSSCQHQLQDMRTELNLEKKARSSVEAQRDEAVKNFLEAQASLEEFQRRNHERIKMLEESEDHLRDSLAHTNAERDELLQRIDSLQNSVSTHEAEIDRLQTLSTMEQATKTDMEAQNLDLRKQLAKLTTRLHKLEEDSLHASVLREENSALRSEVEENRDAISQLEDLMDQLRRQRMLHQAAQLSGLADDSGNSSIHLGTSLHSTAPSSKGRNSFRNMPVVKGAGMGDGNTNNNGSSISNILSELRSMMYDMDDEIKRLRSQLSSQEQDQMMVRDLRAELSVLMEKALKGENQTRELEGVVGKLEADRASLARQVSQLQTDVESRDTQIMTLEARLAQRNTQIIELQEDVSARCESFAQLEKEMWKKASTISQLEAAVAEKRDEAMEREAHLTRVQHEAAAMEEDIKVTRQKVKTQQMELERLRAGEQQNQATHVSQCRQYERQLEILQSEADRKESFSKELQRQVYQAKQDAADKDALIQQLETTLLETKQELSGTTQHSHEAVKQLENKMMESSGQVRQMESALLLCRNEISEHISSMDRTRQQFESELGMREKSIERLEAQLGELQSEVVRRTEDNIQLERELSEKQMALQHCQTRINQLEQSETSLRANVKHLEQQLLNEKAQWMMEADQLEQKLGGQSADLDTALAKMADLRQTVKELQEDSRQKESERLSLERELHSEKATNQQQAARLTRLESDLRDMRIDLEQKIEMVGDLEHTVRNKDTDLEQQRSLVEQLDVDKVRMQREMKQLEEAKAGLEDSVDRLHFDNKAKEQILSDTREILRKTQNELSERSLEATELHEALEERQKELEDRVATVQQLERTIHDTHEEMSQRMQRVDNTLHKYEAEIKERTGQIADLDDRLQQTQSELVETSRQLQQQQQLAHRQQVELKATVAKVDELENVNLRQKQRLEEQKHENVEVTQELRLTREQLQTQHAEFLTARRELAAARREVERLSREVDEVGAAQRSKDQDTARLSEELGTCQARAAQAEAKLAAQGKQMQRDLAELTDKYREELNTLRRARDEALEQQSEMLNKAAVQAQQIGENERVYRQRLETARSELEALHNELSSRKELIRCANEAIFQKDSEIAHLKAQVSRLERHGNTAQHSSAPTALAYHQSATNPTATASVSWNPVLHSTANEPLQRPLSNTLPNQHYYLSSGASHTSPSPLARHDLSHSAHLNTSHNASELPMKDTWADDKDPPFMARTATITQPDTREYITDQLVFSFEKLGSTGGGVVGGGVAGRGGGVCLTEAESKESGGDCDGEVPSATIPSNLMSGSKTETRNDDNNNKNSKKGGGGGGGRGSNNNNNAKSQAALSSRLAMAQRSHQGLGHKSGLHQTKAGTKKGVKPASAGGGSKTQQGKQSAGAAKGDKDFSLHHQDPETLVSTYQETGISSQSGKEMEDLQQQIQANARRQKEIEQQLRSLGTESDDSLTAEDSPVDLAPV